jgi:hypothetical protein
MVRLRQPGPGPPGAAQPAPAAAQPAAGPRARGPHAPLSEIARPKSESQALRQLGKKFPPQFFKLGYKKGYSERRCRKMAEELKGKVDNVLPELPDPCAVGDHVPAIVHRSGGPSAELHNTCGKCGRMILNLAGTWILDVCREEEISK